MKSPPMTGYYSNCGWWVVLIFYLFDKPSWSTCEWYLSQLVSVVDESCWYLICLKTSLIINSWMKSPPMTGYYSNCGWWVVLIFYLFDKPSWSTCEWYLSKLVFVVDESCWYFFSKAPWSLTCEWNLRQLQVIVVFVVDESCWYLIYLTSLLTSKPLIGWC